MKSKLRCQLLESRAQFRAAFANVREQLFVFDDVQKFQRRRRRPAARRQTSCRAFRARSAEAKLSLAMIAPSGKPAGQRLRHGDNVRHARESLVREVAAGAAEAALNFVGDQRGVVLRGQFARALPESFADGDRCRLRPESFRPRMRKPSRRNLLRGRRRR